MNLFFNPAWTAPYGLFFLRVSMGLMMLTHGYPKLVNFAERSATFPDPLGVGSAVSLALAVFAEIFCALAVVIGLKMRWALVPLIITMAVAFFIVHAADPFARKQLALMFLVSYTTLFFTGGGKFQIKE